MPYDTINIETIEDLVHTFYAKVLQDEILRPFFVKALGEDITKGDWPIHFHTLIKFWGLMMKGDRGYASDPFPAHAFLGLSSREPFERWLRLFKEVVDELFTQELALKFYKKANILAEQFIENLGIEDEEED